MSKRFRNKFERSERDFYATPLQSVAPLIPHLKAAGVRAFCEPCAGNDDLVRHLESFGLRCVSSGDIARGQDALQVERFDAPVITNPPFTRNVLLPLLEHFIATARSTWLLLPADFAHVAYARPYLSRCTAIVTAGRARWFGGSGTENVSWFRFTRDHRAGPVFYNGDPTASRTTVCEECGVAFPSSRTDAKTCSDRCRKRLQRRRSFNRDASVTETTCEVSGHKMQGEAA